MDEHDEWVELSVEERLRLEQWKAKIVRPDMHEQLTTEEQNRLGFLRWRLLKGKIRGT